MTSNDDDSTDDDNSQHISETRGKDKPEWYDLGGTDPAPDSNEENTSSDFKEVEPSEEEVNESQWVQPEPWEIKAGKSGREKYEEQKAEDEKRAKDDSRDTSGLSRPSAWNNSTASVRSRLKADVEQWADDFISSGKPINRRNVRSTANNRFGTDHPHDTGELVELLNHLS